MPSLDYIEIIELPAPMAQAVQILKTAQGLAAHGVEVGINARMLESADVESAVRSMLGGPSGPRLHVRPLVARHKGLAGLHHRLRLARRMLAGGGRDAVLYGRSRRQTLQMCRLRGRLGSRARIFYEFHNIECELAREEGDEDRAVRNEAEEREIVQRADGIVVISEPLAEDVTRLFGPVHPPTVVPDAVDLDQFPAPAKGVLEEERVRVVYAGSLYPYKGVDDLVEMLRHLPERVHLTIVGGQSAEDLARLKALARADADLEGRVHFTGLVAPSEVPTHLLDADLICLPAGSSLRSRRYTSPLKLFESMAAGVPIVAAPVPALTSVLEDRRTGLIAPGCAPADLARAVLAAIESPDESRAIGRRAREAAAGFTWHERARRIVERISST